MEAKIPQNLVFLGAKHAHKSIISIQTTNYTSKQKSLKIEGFKSFFFLLNKTYDFLTNLRHLYKRRGQERRKGQDKTGRNGERKGKGEKKGGQGVYTPERGWGKIDYKHSHEKTENLNSLYCI